MKRLLLGAIMLTVLGLGAGVLRFNAIGGAPYAGDPLTFVSEEGEPVEAHWKTDGTVEVRFMAFRQDHLKAFLAEPVRSASGDKYEDRQRRFTFWTKGREATIFQGDDVIFTGQQVLSREKLYFDPMLQEWRDGRGTCLTCTPANGFRADGQIDDAPRVTWHRVSLVLKNDLGEDPPLHEVREVLATHYTADPAQFGAGVSLDDSVFTIIFASEGPAPDLFATDGALRAWYEVRRP